MKIEIITALVFGLVYVFFTYKVRKTSTFDSFAIGDRNINGFFIFASLSATIVGPGFSLGFVSEGFSTGFLFAILASAYGLQMIVVGNYVAPRIRNKFPNAFSLGDIVGGTNSHNDKYLQLLSGIVSFSICVGVVGILTKAGGDIFNVFLGISQSYGAILMTGIVIVYSFFGGIKASILTDTFQFILFIILIPLLFIFLVTSEQFEVQSFISQSKSLTKGGFDSHTFTSTLGLIAWFVFGDILQPPILNRVLASKSSSISKKAFIYTGIFCFFWLILMTGLGITSHLVMDLSTGSDQTLLLLGKNFYPPFLYGLFIIAMLGIVMSSQDSIINAGATVFAKDILQPLARDGILNSKKQLLYSRVATVFIGFAGLLISFLVPSILQGLLFLASIWAPTMLVVILASIFLEEHYSQVGILSIITGFTSSLLWTYSYYSEMIPSILIGILISSVTYITGHKFYKLKNLRT
ncbi:MAG: sodium:solute symporter family protein [Bacteroidota bacterium]